MAKKIIAYHGSDSNFEKFNVSFVGKGNNQNGPGFYFTLDREEAKHYGKYVKKYILTLRKVIPIKGRLDFVEIFDLIKKSPDYEMNIYDWGETEREAFKEIKEGYSNEPSQFHALTSVWFDFYRHNPTEYVNNLVDLGYDAAVVTGEKGYGDIGASTHIIVYNPEAIKEVKE